VCRGAGERHGKLRHLLLIVGFLMTTALRASAKSTPQAGEPVERHLSSDQTFRRWSHDSNSTDQPSSSRSAGYRRLQNADTGQAKPPRTRVRNLVAAHCGTRTRTLPISGCLHQTGPAGARQPAGQARADGPLHRLHGRRAADWLGREHYGNHLSLSKARANRVALAMQEILGLPASAIEVTVAVPPTRLPQTKRHRDGR